ncbi:hypothetical protein MPOCJGCO_0978 [Methylobacterium trifolii]|uniref:Uncharacterized protein n=1 Tax=Methylobacterium trifolii TaxID=1003092 RepID=A0ABQ4TW18_9HYPH|nr:hypothetical protein MPOCJGCO_0978 [Methylobacterium trifolii]
MPFPEPGRMTMKERLAALVPGLRRDRTREPSGKETP